MLRIYDTVLHLLRELQPLIREIERHDVDLARQLRRASSSIALNLAEGAYSHGRNKRARYFTALGSAQESRAAIDIAEIHGYVEPASDALRERFDHVVRTLARLTR